MNAVRSCEAWLAQLWMVAVLCVSALHCCGYRVFISVCYYFLFQILQICLNPFCHRRHDSSDSYQAELQRDEKDAGRASNLSPPETWYGV